LQLPDGWVYARGDPFDGPFLPGNYSHHVDGYASGDINGDGCNDIVTSNSQDGLAFHLGSHCVAPAGPARDAFDGDGKADILWRHAGSGHNQIWLSGRSGQRMRMRALFNTDWTVATTGDFDGDGRADIFWRNMRTGANAIWPGAAPAGMTVRGIPSMDWEVAGSGDFDGD